MAESAIRQKHLELVPRNYNLSKSQKTLQHDLKSSGEAVIPQSEAVGKSITW